MKKYAVIVAGGTGSRMNSATPKQFLLINDKPLIWYTVNAFLESFSDLKIILVLPKSYMFSTENIFSEKELKRIKVVQGGSSRFVSVKNGLDAIKEKETSVVFIHDGARCLVPKKLIVACYEQAVEKGSAIPYVNATDTIRFYNGKDHHIIPRNEIAIIQTPQTFLCKIIQPAFKAAYNEKFTDEASVVEHAGQEVFLIEGDYENIKVTRPADLIIAEQLLKKKNTES